MGAHNASSGVPNFSSKRIADFSPTPGRLDKTESCCFSILFDFLIFLRKGPFVISFRVESETSNFAVCVALGVGIIGILNSNATVESAP